MSFKKEELELMYDAVLHNRDTLNQATRIYGELFLKHNSVLRKIEAELDKVAPLFGKELFD